jgi:hypothetical protein
MGTSFKIFNSTDLNMEIIHEPECFDFELPPNEEVIIETECCEESIILDTSIENGKVTISIHWANSLYRVRYKDEDVFDKYK